MTTPYLSVVAPFYNDAEVAPAFVHEVGAVLNGRFPYELVLVDDGSDDHTPATLLELARGDARLRVLTLEQNRGQQLAARAGLEAARGQYVLLMDGDLQNPPAAIPDLLAEIERGYDIVYAVDTTRNSRLEEWTSAGFWLIMRWLRGSAVIPGQLFMRLMNREFVERFRSYAGPRRSVFGITLAIGMRQSRVRVRNQRRRAGRSSYSLWRRLKLFLEILREVRP